MTYYGETNTFLICLIVAGLIFVSWGAGIMGEVYSTKRWPSTSGIITLSEIGSFRSRTKEGGIDTVYFPDVKYKYEVNGNEYESEDIGFEETQATNEDDIKKFLKKYKVGNYVSVYYSPKNSQIAVLEPGVNKSSYFKLGIGILLLVSGLVSLAGKVS